MNDIPYTKLIFAAMLGSVLGVLPITLKTSAFLGSSLETKIDELKPVVQEAQILGEKAPEKFYTINGQKVYLEIDGKPVEDYVRGNNVEMPYEGDKK